MKTNEVNFPIVSVPFKGAYYMCVEGSKRADALRRANQAWIMGYDELTRDLFKEALESPGCAFEAQEAYESKLAQSLEATDQGLTESDCEDRDGYFFDTQAYYNLYN